MLVACASQVVVSESLQSVGLAGVLLVLQQHH